ncbi:metallophosphoesterase [Pontibacter sp. KCTC 32443]|uniref:metallophosphoesterase n=1 Tax=Pontibacter TaxID=323449 RepID=UPI00164CDEE3|nr:MULTISPECIES: metallophosphoesterase [Pontibacter]MBC5773355.1 metallophosphoesterase [Pontibacter sp. KCTC 32443]
MVQIKDISGYLVHNDESGPFDIIGDVHGCFDELKELLEKLGYHILFDDATNSYTVTPPAKHKAIFIGDLVDRGPKSQEVLRLVMDMVDANQAYCVSGNHDDKLYRKLIGRNVQVRHGLEHTMEQLSHCSAEFIARIRSFLGSLPHHILLDDGRLVIAHAGLAEHLHGSHNRSVRDLCLYGPTTGELDKMGLPVRLDWAANYTGHAIVVYGHTPVQEPNWRNNTINIDTGCVFGGKLTSLTYPDHILTSVPAHKVYAEPVRPFLQHNISA